MLWFVYLLQTLYGGLVVQEPFADGSGSSKPSFGRIFMKYLNPIAMLNNLFEVWLFCGVYVYYLFILRTVGDNKDNNPLRKSASDKVNSAISGTAKKAVKAVEQTGKKAVKDVKKGFNKVGKALKIKK